MQSVCAPSTEYYNVAYNVAYSTEIQPDGMKYALKISGRVIHATPDYVCLQTRGEINARFKFQTFQ